MTTLVADLFLLVAAYGLVLPIGYGGMPFLGGGAFVALGAFGTFQLAAHGVPVLLAALAVVTAGGLAGYVVGFAATRVAGATLALTSWALAWLGYGALVQFDSVSGGASGLFRSPLRLVSPAMGVTVDVGDVAFAVAGGLLVVVIAVTLRRAATGPAGLDWAALRSSAALADSLGVAVDRRRRALLAWGGALAALGGAGGGLAAGVISPADYGPLLSLQLFVAVIVLGRVRWWTPPIGVALIAGLPSLSAHLASVADVERARAESVVTAVLLVLVLALRHRLGALVDRLLPPASATATVGPNDEVPPVLPTRSPVLLRVDAVTVDFGAVRALEEVGLDLHAGEVHALIGPNGSGKSTLLAVAAGTVRPRHGRVEIDGVAVAPRGTAADHVRLGVARTWQHVGAFADVPVAAEVAVGARVGDPGLLLASRDVVASPSSAAARRARADRAGRALAATGLHDVADRYATELDGAALSFLQIARVVATGSAVVLLDEPAAGLAGEHRDRLAALLRALAQSGRGVLLVEHDMTLVADVADRVTVLDAGRVIATGRPEQIRADPAVRRAYLGDGALPVRQ